MKKIFVLLMVGILAIGLAACGNDKKTGETNDGSSPAGATAEVKAPDLTGNWTQSNSNTKDSYQVATISGNTIEIYWYTAAVDSKSLYWAGTFEAPKSDAAYTWDSVNDKSKTGEAMLASSADTKTFSYDKGVISYEASAMGANITVELKKD